MSTVVPTITPVWGPNSIDGWQVVWPVMQTGDVGQAVGSTIGNGVSAVPAPGGAVPTGFVDKSVQVTGTFGAGGNVAFEGNNDGSGSFWFDLSDPQGNPIAISAAILKQLEEVAVQVRPHVTSGDGTTSLTVTMFARKSIAT
jgi:catechol 2,3-dioxygenase-like lactoylglutathione lyase family enzyme